MPATSLGLSVCMCVCLLVVSSFACSSFAFFFFFFFFFAYFFSSAFTIHVCFANPIAHLVLSSFFFFFFPLFLFPSPPPAFDCSQLLLSCSCPCVFHSHAVSVEAPLYALGVAWRMQEQGWEHTSEKNKNKSKQTPSTQQTDKQTHTRRNLNEEDGNHRVGGGGGGWLRSQAAMENSRITAQQPPPPSPLWRCAAHFHGSQPTHVTPRTCGSVAWSSKHCTCSSTESPCSGCDALREACLLPATIALHARSHDFSFTTVRFSSNSRCRMCTGLSPASLRLASPI